MREPRSLPPGPSLCPYFLGESIGKNVWLTGLLTVSQVHGNQKVVASPDMATSVPVTSLAPYTREP